jgi:anaerobic magnesium-protoporphyrin IX monomethyl ester cyclase
MKVLLVNPPSLRPLRSILPPEVEDARGRFPPLGLLYLAGAIQDLPGVEVMVIDAQAEDLTAAEVGQRVARDGIDLVGITVLTFSLLDAIDVAAAVKAARPAAVVIAGGPHPHLYPEATLRLGPLDAVVRGEGEESLRALIAGWPETSKTPPAGVWWKDGARGEPEVAPFIEQLDGLAFPARELSRVQLYHSVLSGARPITTMMSSRGCRHRCVFCDRPHLGKRFRARSAANVVDEMETCAGLGVREIVFYDDTFTTDPARVAAIAETIMARGLRLPWDIRARVSDLQPDDYRRARRAGLVRIHFGVETGDPDLLRSLQKGISLDQVRAAFRAARDAGLETLAYFMVGLPGETPATLQATLDLALELDPDYVHFSILIPFPGTPIYQQGLERGIIGHDVWAEFAADPRPDFTPPVWEEKMSSAELLTALARMYQAFYRRPRVVLRRLARVRSISGLGHGLRMGLRIFRLKGDRT